MEEQLKQRLLAMVENMPAFPQSVQKVLELTADVDCSPKDLVKVVEHDPVMTMKMLKMVNSAFFGLRNKIISIDHALVYLGLNTVKNMALAIATVGMLDKFDTPRFNSEDFLLHSLIVAAVSRKLGESLPESEYGAMDFFIAGLLHDFGKIVLFQFMRSEFSRALELAYSAGMTLNEAEVEVIGTDHGEVGGMLGDYWGLSVELVNSMREHHSLHAEQSPLSDCVIGANLVVKLQRGCYAGNQFGESLPERIQQSLGISTDDLLDMLGDLADEERQARIFMQL